MYNENIYQVNYLLLQEYFKKFIVSRASQIPLETP